MTGTIRGAQIRDLTIDDADIAVDAAIAYAKLALTDSILAADIKEGAEGTIPVNKGGSGAATLTDHSVLVGSGTDAITPISTGTAGQILTSGGADADPSFEDCPLSSMDFWSAAAPVADTTISTTQATKAITPTVVVPSGSSGIPAGVTIDCVHILAKWRQTEDSSGADNAIDNTANTMQIQIDDDENTGWLTAYDFVDGSYFVDGDVYSIGAGDMIEGVTDIKARVDAADTYDIQLLNAECDGDNLIFRDFMWGLRIWWH